MGNYRFKLSDMIPNAWFYKMRDMGKARKQTQTTQSRKKKQSSPASTTHTKSSKPKQPHQSNIPRKSYYFTRELNTSDRSHTSPANNQNISDTNFPQQPRKSSKQRPKRRTPRASSPKLVTSSVVTAANCSCHNTNLESMSTKSNSPPEYSSSSPLDSSGESEFPEPEFRTDRVLPTESFDDIIIDVDNNSIPRKGDKLEGCDPFSGLVLPPPIVTKPAKFNDLLSDAKKQEAKPRSRMNAHEELNVKGSLKVKIVKEDTTASMKEHRNTPCRRFSVSSPGVRLRINSPRVGVGSRRVQAHGRKSVSPVVAGSGSRRSLSDSFAIVKSSFNPQRDFRESMVEMIVQNNIRTSKDLEDLLACYLSLNSDEYHGLIIKVFKQIWFDLTDNM